jgi:hypothetical protein
LGNNSRLRRSSFSQRLEYARQIGSATFISFVLEAITLKKCLDGLTPGVAFSAVGIEAGFFPASGSDHLLRVHELMASPVVQIKSAILTDGRQILCPFDKRECLSLTEATGIAGKSESTVRGWCGEHGLGRRVGSGTWSVSKVALAMFLDGDAKALRAYHAGDRSSELVIQYYNRAVVERRENPDLQPT